MSLRMVFWDVQHGSAAYIKTPNGKHIVQDLGVGSHKGYGKTFSPLLYLEPKYGVTKLDYVIITHPHKDHIDDIMNFDKLSPRAFICPTHLTENEVRRRVKPQDKHLFDKYFEINKKYKDSVSDEENPRLPENNGGVRIDHFIPRSCSRDNINNHSLVSVFSYAGIKVILTGDNEPPSWKELLGRSDFKKGIKDADILLAPHHGRETGFCKELFNHFTPKLTIVSDDVEIPSSATPRYTKISSGWKVHHRDGKKPETRKCLTTRSDHAIVVDIGYEHDGNMKVTID